MNKQFFYRNSNKIWFKFVEKALYTSEENFQIDGSRRKYLERLESNINSKIFLVQNRNIKTINNISPNIEVNNVVQNDIIVNNIKIMTPGPIKKVNMDYIVHDYTIYHRAGWKFVLDAIQPYNDPDAEIIFDNYLDETFLWKSDILEGDGKIPFTAPWFGVLHHPPNTDYSSYNAVNVINNPLFIASLPVCKCIITLTEYLKNWLQTELNNLGFNTIPVYAIVHPTLFVPTLFSPSHFLSNNNKKVVQIGAWMRDTYAIFRLLVDKKLQKVAIKIDNMDGYYKPSLYDFFTMITNELDRIGNEDNNEASISGIQILNFLKSNPSNNFTNMISDPHIYNKYLAGMQKSLQENDDSVNIITYISDDDYDALLQNNLVFIYLVDASACNTLNECIVRNTPIIINKIPPVVEILGNDYPLYYSTIEEATILLYKIITEKILLYMAYYYLLFRVNKDKFKINTFVNKFSGIINSL